MKGKFKKYGEELSISMIELRLAISLREPMKTRKSKDTYLEEIVSQIKENLEKIDLIASKTLKKASEQTTPSKDYEKTKKISTRTKETLEKIVHCETLLERRKGLRSSKSIERINSKTLDDFQEIYEDLKKLSTIF